jgi:hypothetical protein
MHLTSQPAVQPLSPSQSPSQPPFKRQRTEELKTLLQQCEAETPEYDESIVGVIKREINKSKFTPATPVELQLDHVLSSVSYREMLESLFGSLSDSDPHQSVLPVVTKAYEESYMREAGLGERPCAMGAKCECMFIDRDAPFVCVEFDVPGERATDPRLCVLCSRKTTQKLFFDACFSGRRAMGVIQRYGNLCNQPGEYARECMLICPPGAPWHCLPLPIMSHQRNKYRVQIVAGVKHLQQLRVAFEDFFGSPSGR